MTVHIITADILKTILKTFEAFQKSMKSLSEQTLPQGKYFLNVSAHPLFLRDEVDWLNNVLSKLKWHSFE